MTEYKYYPYFWTQGNAGQLEIQLQAAQARIAELEEACQKALDVMVGIPHGQSLSPHDEEEIQEAFEFIQATIAKARQR